MDKHNANVQADGRGIKGDYKNCLFAYFYGNTKDNPYMCTALLLANDANNKGSAKKKLNTYHPHLLLLHFSSSSEEGGGRVDLIVIRIALRYGR